MKEGELLVIWIRPETRGFSHEQVDNVKFEDRTRVCGNKLGWLVAGSEKLVDFGDSWFSAKAI